MGVDIATWASVVRKHPLSFKFEGLTNDKHATFAEAYRRTDSIYQARFDDAVQMEIDCIDPDHEAFDADRYEHYVEIACDGDTDNDTSDKRYRWAFESIDDLVSCDPDWLFYDLDDEECVAELMEEHPPVAVFDHAAGEWIDIDDVVFICPSCGNQPITEHDGALPHFYCGLCGCEGPSDYDGTLEEFAEDVGVTLHPFKSEAD